MIDKLNDYPIGQILAYFGYYKLENSNSYYLFKNSLGSKIYIYQDENSNENYYFVYHDFKSLNKKNLIIYLLQNRYVDDKSLALILEEIDTIGEFEEIKLLKKRNQKFFIDQIFGLTKHSEYFSILDQNIFIRNNECSVILYRHEKPIDVLSSSGNSSYTVFGNTIGSYLKPGEKLCLITFNPSKIINKIDQLKYYSIFFCSEELSFSNYKKINQLENIRFFTRTENEKYFAIKYLIYSYNEVNKDNPIYIYKNSSIYYIEVNLHDKNKLEILKFNSKFNKVLVNGISNDITGSNFCNTDYTIENKILTIRMGYTIFNLDKTLEFLMSELNIDITY